ncbi:hypothetical protein KIH23_10185 [Flavobacterium sp. CYK-55]|uniref:SF0329 family protein n=1 Tax=Flavobacterium sp. CYK-55 TaxID=2835529 RepID=UPI001BCE695F|nr:hypothetical protein [Flavobacterium sp. CYK-55]MBS7787666.1 hypothetical protein [Flavobacterium sp. CYK-55]
MMWSKIKKNVENHFAERLKGRIQLYTTTYTKDWYAGEIANRGWITVDGEEVVDFSTLGSFHINRLVYHDTTPTNCVTLEKIHNERTSGKLIEKGEFSKYDLTNCCYAYLEMNIEECLLHESPIINMLAVLDKRLGKRRLLKLNDQNLHPLVRFFLDIRLDSEKIRVESV